MWDRTVIAKLPRVIIRDKKEKTCLLIDIALPDDSNANTKENKKLIKYKGLEVGFSRMWKVGTKIVPVIIGASETIKK
jgi:chemotaxis receptor (MCP) glutamine deamidase CheD